MRLTRLTPFVILLALCASPSGAASLEWAGAVGNSGATREAWPVVRGAIGRSGGGVVVGREGRIMTGGGDRILALSRDGKLLWSTPLPQKDWVLSGPTFAIAGKYLYFFAGHALSRGGFMNLLWPPWTEVEPNLCRCEMYPGAKAQIVVPLAKLGWVSPWTNGSLPIAADPTDGALYIGAYSPTGFKVYRVQPDGTLVEQIATPPSGRFAIDETGRWYFGGGSIIQADKTGTPLPGTQPVPLPSLGAVASAYTGADMLTRGQIWDMGIYGFVGRFTKQFQADPGAVSQWNHALYFVAQIADAPDGAYYVKSTEALYLAKVVDGQLILSRRFGSIPEGQRLRLLPDGYIGVGNDQTNFLWYDYAASDPAAAPVRAEYTGPSAQGYVNGNTFDAYTIGDYSAPLDYAPGSKSLSMAAYKAEPFHDGGNIVAHIHYGSYPVSQIAAVAHAGNWVFALDTKLNMLLRGSAATPCDLTPITPQPVPTGTITSVAGIGVDTLLIGSDTGITVCGVTASGTLTVRSTYQLPAANGAFGKRVFLTGDGNRVIVADSDRHRVVVLRADEALSTLTYVAQFGETDAAGAGDDHLDTPTLVSCSAGRIVVYDSGNQRIVKLRIHE